jgi:hypothetical protein
MPEDHNVLVVFFTNTLEDAFVARFESHAGAEQPDVAVGQSGCEGLDKTVE